MEEDKTLEKEVDFDVIEEPWARYLLKDGTLIRFRTAVTKIFESLIKGPMGYPNFRIAVQPVASTIVPDDLKGEPTPMKEPKPEDFVEESKIIQRSDDVWQRYKTKDGWIIKVKVSVRKIFKSNKFNDEHEPASSTRARTPTLS